jgi:Domain of unknown function (DUF1848).
MATWNKEKILTDDGLAEAQFPLIVSASRSTDIPAFYSDWFFDRLKKGYSAWTNPFNGVKSYVAYRDTRFIVFWSKNPAPLIPYLDYLDERKIRCYIQYTLNDYVSEGLEKGVPDVDARIETFKALVDRLGKGHVIWRFDPLILTDRISVDDLLKKIEYIGDRLTGYTEKLVFSFVDIAVYRKVRNNLEAAGIKYTEWTTELMEQFCEGLASMNSKWGYTLATCGEKIDLKKYGIQKNRCVDDDLMIRFAYDDPELMKLLHTDIIEADLFGAVPEGAIDLGNGKFAVKNKDNSDKGQREFCGCVISKDIGEYNTCVHLCEYCYANSSKTAAVANFKCHKANPDKDTITGR